MMNIYHTVSGTIPQENSARDYFVCAFFQQGFNDQLSHDKFMSLGNNSDLKDGAQENWAQHLGYLPWGLNMV